MAQSINRVSLASASQYQNENSQPLTPISQTRDSLSQQKLPPRAVSVESSRQIVQMSSEKNDGMDTGLIDLERVVGCNELQKLSSVTSCSSSHSEQSMPVPKSPHWFRVLRYQILSTYRRLNTILILANLIVIAVLAGNGSLRTISPAQVSNAVGANLTLSILIRQEVVINTLFFICGSCPTWLPLSIRRRVAKIYCLGGVHSGAAISATMWFFVLNYSIIRTFQLSYMNDIREPLLGMTIALDVLLSAVIFTSMPRFRAAWHNLWECIHRFAGWTSLALFWAHFGLFIEADRKSTYAERNIFEMIMKSPLFWMLAVSTCAIIWPWARLRKVKVDAQHLSDHAIRLSFRYANVSLCSGPRFTDAPLKEWHSFAAIPNEDGYGFSIIIAKAGDWTSKVIQSPPKYLWTRGVPTSGVLHIAGVFKTIVLVATGSGIGPVLSLLQARKVACRILWVTASPRERFDSVVVDSVTHADSQAIIFDTTTRGRPNLAEEAYKLYVQSNAEAVFVISNPRATYATIFELESRGIPAFAPIFDS